MTISVADRGFQTSSTTGTATYQLAAGPAGFIGFISGVGSGKKVGYIADDGTNWECGIGTVTAGSPDTLTRTTVLSSSNSGALVNWGAGTRNIRLAPLAKLVQHRDENLCDVEGYGASAGTGNAHTLTTYPGILGYSDGMEIRYFAPAGNTGATTVNVDGRGAKDIRYNGVALTSGSIPTGSLVVAVYKFASGWFELVNNPQITLDSISPTTTKGDIIVDNGTVPVRLAVGTNGQLLVPDSAQASGLKWANIGGSVRAKPSTNQSLTTSTWTTIALGAEDHDDLGAHDNTTNNSRLTALVAGRYRVTAMVATTSTTNKLNGIRVLKNGSYSADLPAANVNTTGGLPGETMTKPPAVTEIITLAANDYIEVQTYTNAGSDAVEATGTRFMMELIRLV